MRNRWPWIFGFGLIAALQLALIIGAGVLHSLSRQKMMVMRYLFAKNLVLEQSWFSPAAKNAQMIGLAVMAAALLVATALAARRGSWFAFGHSAIGVALAGVGVWLLVSVEPSAEVSVYATVLALWLVLALQVVALAVAKLERSTRKPPS